MGGVFRILLYAVLTLGHEFTAARCEVEMSALAKREGVRRMCVSLADVYSTLDSTTKGANSLRTSAAMQTMQLQNQVALLSKEKVSLEGTVAQDVVLKQDNEKLVGTVKQLEHKVENERAASIHFSESLANATVATHVIQRRQAATDALATQEVKAVSALQTELKVAKTEATSGTKAREEMEGQAVREAAIAAGVVKQLEKERAQASSSDAQLASSLSLMQSLQQELARTKKDLAASQAEHARVTDAHATAQANAESQLAVVWKELKSVSAERDQLRAAVKHSTDDCQKTVHDIRQHEQKELARAEKMLSR